MQNETITLNDGSTITIKEFQPRPVSNETRCTHDDMVRTVDKYGMKRSFCPDCEYDVWS